MSTTPSTFISGLYQNVLRRTVAAGTATNAELLSWDSLITAGILTQAQATTAIVNSVEATTIVAPIIRIYQTFFNRVPDSAGLDFWAGRFRTGTSLATISSSFASAAEFTAAYGTPSASTIDSFLSSLYTNVLGRTADSAGFTFWKNTFTSLGSNAAAAAQIANSFASSAEFTTNSSANITALLTSAASTGSLGSGPLGGSGGSSSGTTFTLTTAADQLTGTSGNDTFNGFIGATAGTTTLTGADSINGGSGTDTLSINTDTAGSLTAAIITNVEVFKIRDSGAGTYDFSTVVGETSVINSGTGAVTFNNVASGATITQQGDGNITHGATTFTMAAATDAVILTIDGGVKGGNITRNATGAATITVNSTGAANTIGTLDVDTATAVKGLTIAATTNLTASLAADYAASSSLTVTGAATKVDLSGAALSANFSKVDASGMTAGGVLVKVDQTDTTVDTQFIGGVGADTLDIGKVVYNSATLTAVGGTGTDTIKLNDQAAWTSATVKNITGFETFSVYDDNDGALDTFDLSLSSTITSLTVAADSAGDGYAFTNMTATQAAAVTISGSNNNVGPTFTIANATTVGNIDTLTIDFNDGSSTVNTLTVADITAAGAELINFKATDNITASALTGLTAMTTLTVTGAGAVSLTSGALALNVNTVIDASAVTGTVTIDFGNATTNGASIKGSLTKANTITGDLKADTIVGGSAADTLANVKTGVNATAGDSLTGGAGNDTFILRGDIASGTVSTTYYGTAARITDFTVGSTTTTTDILQLSATIGNYSGGSAFFAGVAAAANGSTGVQSVAQNATAAAIVAGTDLIKLTTAVAPSTTLQAAFNSAIGTATVTGLTAGDDIFASFYDSTNSRAVIVLVDANSGTNTAVETGDTVTLVGTIDMTSTDYASFGANHLSIIAA